MRRVVLSIVLAMVLAAPLQASPTLASERDCLSYAYACTPGYTGANAAGTWAWSYYGGGWAQTANGYHNCTLYAAWRLVQNGMGSPGRSWGNAVDWAASIGGGNHTPAVGSIAWWGGSRASGFGHVAYVEQVSGGNVFVRADSFVASGGYTSAGWIPASSVELFLHPHDVAQPPPPPPPPPPAWTAAGQIHLGRDHLAPGQTLRPRRYLLSQDSRFALTLQTDGNLVVYGPSGAPRWNSGTNGQPVRRAVMQTDGNFVLYRADGTPAWNSQTNGRGRATLTIQDDGNVVVRRVRDASPTWNSGTGGAGTLNALGTNRRTSGQHILRSRFIQSADGRFVAVLQSDGNFVVYGPGYHVLWNSGTQGTGANRAEIQGDGNFVIYRSGSAVWNSHTPGQGRVRLVMQDDGNLVLYRTRDNVAVWNTETNGRV